MRTIIERSVDIKIYFPPYLGHKATQPNVAIHRWLLHNKTKRLVDNKRHTDVSPALNLSLFSITVIHEDSAYLE